MTRFVCLSDTHLAHDQGSSFQPAIVVPDGDILVHAGDMTWRGDRGEMERAFRLIESLPHPHKIVIAGNRDWLFGSNPSLARQLVPPGVLYLQDGAAEISNSVARSPSSP